MFDNVGGKIKGVARFVTWLGIIASVIVSLALLIMTEAAIILALVILVVGCVVSWLSSLTLYGFGQLIENSDKIAGMHGREGLSEGDDCSYKNDPYFKATAPDERTFEQIVDSSNLAEEQKKRIKEVKEKLEDDLIDVSDCCKRIRYIASDQPEELITKLISRL